MTQPFLCPHCGNDGWSASRTHTVYETLQLHNIRPDGCYEEEGGDFGDTIETGEWEEIVCNHCDSDAPANHPLWPEKEAPHA